MDARSSIMHWPLFVCALLGVLLIPAESHQISVCIEDDRDLRVDCAIELKPNVISSYEFSWASGSKESLINTNVSGSVAEKLFEDKGVVSQLEPHGYRLTLTGFTDTLPHNTTYICKVSGKVDSITVEADQLVPCSAVFVKSSCSWIACLLLLLFYHTRIDQ